MIVTDCVRERANLEAGRVGVRMGKIMKIIKIELL